MEKAQAIGAESEKDIFGTDELLGKKADQEEKDVVKDDKSDDEKKEKDNDQVPPSDDVYFEPIMKLERQTVSTLEENEEEIFSVRAKLFRFDKDSKEWKERGLGCMRFLKHKETKKVRIVMRRDKIGKLCSNHYITSDMKLVANVSSNKSWMWSTPADMSEGKPSEELLAAKFSKAEEAESFKEFFEKAQKEAQDDKSKE